MRCRGEVGVCNRNMAAMPEVATVLVTRVKTLASKIAGFAPPPSFWGYGWYVVGRDPDSRCRQQIMPKCASVTTAHPY